MPEEDNIQVPPPEPDTSTDWQKLYNDQQIRLSQLEANLNAANEALRKVQPPAPAKEKSLDDLLKEFRGA